MTRYKQPNEIKPIGIDFSPWLPVGETLLGTSNVKVYDAANQDVSSSMLQSQTINSPYLDGLIKAGTDGQDYKITFTAVTQNDKWEYDVILKVREQ